jgi:cation diffusion facilitator CzcD-associated flavoprotein CzcO
MSSTPSARLDALVVGGGQAGLAAGYYLQRAGLRFAILDAGPEPAGLWPLYYDDDPTATGEIRCFGGAHFATELSRVRSLAPRFSSISRAGAQMMF